jgi:hypothetical protein
MQTTPKSSEPTRSAATTGDKIRQHADIARVAIKYLMKRGLIKLYRVLSKDGTTVKEYRLVLSAATWTEDLQLRLLSDGKTTVAESVVEEGGANG